MANLSNRDKIRFMEVFEDFTVDRGDNKLMAVIGKREHNPELSVFSNMVLDLVDFKDRVRPLSKDVAMVEQARRYQKRNVNEVLDRQAQFQKVVDELQGGAQKPKEKIAEAASEGYSSMEIPEPKAEEPVEEPVVE